MRLRSGEQGYFFTNLVSKDYRIRLQYLISVNLFGTPLINKVEFRWTYFRCCGMEILCLYDNTTAETTTATANKNTVKI